MAAGPVAPAPGPLPGSVDHIGAAACAQCHAGEFRAWLDSDHRRAMQAPGPESVLGDFDGVRIEHDGRATVFSREDGRYRITTEGPGGRPGTFEVRYAFGHFPLQQYLLELPGGRLQAFGMAWDSRGAGEGGQRWLQLYPDAQAAAGQRLHWTGRDQNWNFMCAECHATALSRNYDADTDTYATRWSEPHVACEACHGPGLAHARWAAGSAAQRRADPDKGLAVRLDERRDAHWIRHPGTTVAQRSRPRGGRVEIDTCGRCHGRASPLGDAGVAHGGSLLDSHRPALLEADQFWPDGQMRGEVFNWAPFLQSRMQAAGVNCSDCHEPHGLKLRAQGNALCSQCHQADHYDRPSHTHHEPGSEAARCTACHMPTTTFMQVDARHDHGFRIPRPDLAARLGTPDACTGCHAGRDPSWAADRLADWFPHSRHRSDGFAIAFAADDSGDPAAAARLAHLAAASGEPAIVRASALRRLARDPGPAGMAAAVGSVTDSDPLVRMAAMEVLAWLEPRQRASRLAPLLGDPVRAVRIEAANALAGEGERQLAGAERGAFAAALDEYLASLAANAERPDAVTSLGELHQRRGEFAAAEAAYRRALRLEPDFENAWLQWADLLRSSGDEAQAASVLREGLGRLPASAGLHHGLGLSLVRQGQRQQAVAALEQAAALGPGVARYGLVLGVALHDWGDPQAGREALRVALESSPRDRDLLRVLAGYELEAGNRAAAEALLERLLEADPTDGAARQFLESLRQGP